MSDLYDNKNISEFWESDKNLNSVNKIEMMCCSYE